MHLVQLRRPGARVVRHPQEADMARKTQLVVALAALLYVVAIAQLIAQQTHITETPGPDPAVKTYTVAYRVFVEAAGAEYPVNPANIVCALDTLASAIEGLALDSNCFSVAELEYIHQVRRDIRRLTTTTDSPGLTAQRAHVFVRTAQLLSKLSEAMPETGADKALLDAAARAAVGLDRDYPLRMQPYALKNFFGYAAKALQQIDGKDRGHR
jgi:hypothetical protein